MNEAERPQSSQLIAELRALDEQLCKAGLRYAMIGGVAVNIHGYVRATRDLDMLMSAEDTEAVHDLLRAMGYESFDRKPDLASYIRETMRVDVLFARRPISRRLLEKARQTDYCAMRIPAISLEGLIGLKVQAFNDDPVKRLRDLPDIIELFKINRGRLDLDEIRSYFRLFDKESLLDDILKSIG